MGTPAHWPDDLCCDTLPAAATRQADAPLSNAPAQYRSSGQRGSPSPFGADARRVKAHKLRREVDVHFTPLACTVQTAEGIVHAAPGDAIVTGTAGERWRVSRTHFAERYRPVAPTRPGESGRYESLPIQISALPMTDAFEVLLADGVSLLKGRAGDWLVDYGDGSLGIVSQAVFATTYAITG